MIYVGKLGTGTNVSNKYTVGTGMQFGAIYVFSLGSMYLQYSVPNSVKLTF